MYDGDGNLAALDRYLDQQDASDIAMERVIAALDPFRDEVLRAIDAYATALQDYSRNEGISSDFIDLVEEFNLN